MGRKRKNLDLPKRILILCEGESEEIYIKGLKKELYKQKRFQTIEVELYQPKDYSPKGIVTEAKKRISEAKKDKYPFFSIWVVFDKDNHANIPHAYDIAENSNPKIDIAFSNICFEIWILLHFEKTKKYFKNSYQIIKHLSEKHNLDYGKTMNIYEAVKDNTTTALTNSAWLLKQNSFDLETKKPYELDCYTDFSKLHKHLTDVLK
jgi:hypothetical protein